MPTLKPIRSSRASERFGETVRSVIVFGLLAVSAPWLSAQPTTAPARLAIVVEDPSAAVVGDMLTAELSKRKDLQLLERAQIERVYREQALSAANKDYMKLGRLLGADGLLLLQPTHEGTNQFLSARLVAVGPGVVIGAARSSASIATTAQWAKWVG